MEEKIIAILNDVKEGINYQAEQHLIEDKLLDSFDVVAIIGELDEAFEIEITMDDMTPENFNSVQAMADLVKRLQSR